eukprot:31079-Pelagococcus_subviridis.AAC.14
MNAPPRNASLVLNVTFPTRAKEPPSEACRKTAPPLSRAVFSVKVLLWIAIEENAARIAPPSFAELLTNVLPLMSYAVGTAVMYSCGLMESVVVVRANAPPPPSHASFPLNVTFNKVKPAPDPIAKIAPPMAAVQPVILESRIMT